LQALAAQDADLDLRHVEPAGVLGCVVKLHPALTLDQPLGRWLLGAVWAGAALYTAGTVFYRNRLGLRHAHGTWHLFVLGGTLSHYFMVARIVL
jgi:hemolysin III